MVYEVKNAVALVTGAATGIGALVVRYLLRDGAKFVAVLDIDVDEGRFLEKELNSGSGHAGVMKFVQCDVSDEEQLFEAYKTILEEHDYIDIVINNAGLMNDSLKIYKRAIDLNITALVTSTLKAMEVMRKDLGGKGGTVINISSVAALCQDPLLPIYFGTKSAVLQFSNCIGLPEYYMKTGVRVLAMCFGATDTALLSDTKLGSFDAEYDAKLPEYLKPFRRQSPESPAQGVIEAYKRGDSGSTWLATHDEPAKDITPTIKKAYEILSSLVFY